MLITNLKNKSIAILGFGKEGRSTLDFLLSLKISKKNIIILDNETDIFTQHKNIKIISGEKYLDHLDEYDIIIKSPGISPYNQNIFPHLTKITSQTQIFFSNYSGKIIGITATKGKTTIASIAYQTIKNAGYSVELVGNIGHPVLSTTLQKLLTHNAGKKIDYVVYELSSYMLESFIPQLYIGLLGNIFPDHIDWHNHSFDIYTQAKLNILTNVQYTIDGREILADSKNILQNIETPLLGEHNIRNISLVFAICKILKIPKKILLDTVKTFQAIPHRLEKIAEKEGIIFIDDAISTTPESTIEGIKTFGNSIGTLFLGGLDRGYNFENLICTIQEYNILNIVLFPETGDIIEKLLMKKEEKSLCNNQSSSLLSGNTNGIASQSSPSLSSRRGIIPCFNILKTSSMKEAVHFAFQQCKQGEVCLLSTASPSYNLYKNYIEQGNDFKKEIYLYM